MSVGDIKTGSLVLNSSLPDATFRDILCVSDFVINYGWGYLTLGSVRVAISYGVPVITYLHGTSLDMACDAVIFSDEECVGFKRALKRV